MRGVVAQLEAAFDAGGQLVHADLLFDHVAVHVGQIAAHTRHHGFEAAQSRFDAGIVAPFVVSG